MHAGLVITNVDIHVVRGIDFELPKAKKKDSKEIV